MRFETHLAELQEHGERLAAAAEKAGLDAWVPTCPDWTVADLVRHQGTVHRWAAAHIAERRLTVIEDETELGRLPDDDSLLAWYQDGLEELVATLTAADPDVECFTFLPGSGTPLQFWARRQAHETTVHGVDAATAAGIDTPIDAELAVDGIDEVLLGFLGRPRGRLVADPPVRLGVQTSDTGHAWTITIGPDRRSTVARLDEADCVVRGRAADLYLLLWNRIERDRVEVDGDTGVLDLWRAKARVTWS